MKKSLKIIPYFIIAILVGVTITYAGSLTPPGSVANTMYSLTDIYNLASGTTTTEGIGAIGTTPGTIAETGKTLTEVYDAIAEEIEDISASTILTGTTIFGVEGTAVAGAPSPTFASANVSSYNCSWFTDMTDPDDIRGIPVTSEQICGYNTGCSWVDGACTGGVQTGATYITWYAGVEACANSTEDGQTAGTWRLPTYPELINYYLDNNINGAPPTGFASDGYWSGTTYQYPAGSGTAYFVDMFNGIAGYGVKYGESGIARCAR
jgi:hypothetical protein